MPAKAEFKVKTEGKLIKRLLQACVREELLPHSISENTLIIPLSQSQTTLLASDVQQFYLGKLKIHGDVAVISSGQLKQLTQVRDLMQLIYQEIKDSVESAQWEKFASEIDNCNANEIVANQFIHQLNANLAKQMMKNSAPSLIEYMKSQHSPVQQLIFFESWASKGHPYHPCHKTKLGFNAHAHLKFSPEFNRDILLPLAAIEKSMLHVKSEAENFNYNDWFAEQYPQQWQIFCEKLTQNNLSETTHYPVFIHPWQYDNTLIHLFKDAISSKKIVLFQDVFLTTKASLSFRTMMVKDNPTQPHIKLPVAIQSTSAMRTITPGSVNNGPQISKIIKQILSVETHLHSHIKFAYEICGLHSKHEDHEIAKHLGVIYRDNPAALVSEQQTPMVVAALFEESPTNRVPLFIEILQRARGSNLQDAIDYFSHYTHLVITAYLDLFLIYGIALEGHQQNTIAVFEDFQPRFMIARDLGGLRIHLPTLEAQGYPFTPYPNSATATQDRQEVTNKFLHTVIQYHLGELILVLAQHYKTPENIYWKIVKNHLHDRFHQIKNKVDPTRWLQEYKAIFKEDWQVKSLMRMRLENVYSKYVYIDLRNPLRDA